MKLDDFKQADGGFKFNDIDCENAEDLLHVGLLGFCGCGQSQENLLYILGGLELINDNCPVRVNDDNFEKWHKEKDIRVVAHFGNINAAYFFYYWTDKKDLTEHGGSVPGWLTDKGKEMLGLFVEWRDFHYTATDQDGENNDKR